MPDKNKNLTLEQILEEFRVVLALEEKAASTYLQLAQDCSDEEAKEMLFEIARQESAHVEIAKKLVQSTTEWAKRRPRSPKM